MFVEEFILDQTLEPALADRPLEGFRMIDPTCGSGHFLLGAFNRLLDRWQKYAPAMDRQALVQRALDAVNGVDLNPFAVAIARFRLTVAALQASGLTSLESAPAFDFHLAAGDSLLHGPGQQTLGDDTDLSDFVYETEDLELLRTLLAGGSYDAVVGNPPYITVKDKVLNLAYRGRYGSCKGKYAMTVPFMERFFGLAKNGDGDQPAGWVGQITSNSFMKREFGSKLIEGFLVRQDLRLVADTSGAYIPGHGTPTVIIVGRHQRPISRSVRAVLGVRSEPGRPAEPAKGIVWSSIVRHVDEPGWDDTWITVTDLDRTLLDHHPWSLGGGGSGDLLQRVGSAGSSHLSSRAARIGFFGIIGSDPAMLVPRHLLARRDLEDAATRRFARGEDVRDFGVNYERAVWFPYDQIHDLRPELMRGAWARHLWANRTDLGNRPTFKGGTYFSEGRPWFEWHQLPKDDHTARPTMIYANVATHSHFSLVREASAFSPHASVIKLPAGATEDDHLALLGILNSSTACFWLKQNSHSKGGGGIGGGIASEEWEHFYEFTATTLQEHPLPEQLPVGRAPRRRRAWQARCRQAKQYLSLGPAPSSLTSG